MRLAGSGRSPSGGSRGEPVVRILGEKEFLGLAFALNEQP